MFSQLKAARGLAKKLIKLGCDRCEAEIAAMACCSLRPEGFRSESEMAAISSCEAKIGKSINEI